MTGQTILGIDMGGTGIRAGLVKDGSLLKSVSQKVNASGKSEEVLEELFSIIDKLIDPGVVAIGMGVPGLVDPKNGTVYDVWNIPAWKEINLAGIIRDRYQLPVKVNNDSNCFALGELYYGKGRKHDSFIGITLGTGMGCGIIINKRLYAGFNGGAGEIGMADYLDKTYEYYASGQFFKNVHQEDGEIVFEKALAGETGALELYNELGMHLGNAIKTVLFAYDINLVILGGSVRHAYQFFAASMMKQIQTFPFTNAVKNLRIEISELENSGIMGAASLTLEN